MQTKIIYIVPILALESTISLGVKRKILGQANGFHSHGWEVDIVDSLVEPKPYPDWAQFEYPFLIKLLRLPFKRAYQFFDSLIFKRKSFRKVINHAAKQGDAIVYLRHAFLSPQVVLLYARLKHLENVRRIYLEIPTWPYDQEPHARFYEKALRPLIKKYVDRVVTFGDFKSIFGVSTIRIHNGIDVGAIPLASSNSRSGQVNLIACGSLNSWVGLDRLLYGLRHYFDSNQSPVPLKVSVVGTGRKFEAWRRLSGKLNLGSIVEFKGPMSGEELDKVFDRADLALGNIANHRRGLSSNADLKNREYCVRGVPFVISGDDPAFPETFPFVFRVKPDNSKLDISRILRFLKDTQEQHPDFRQQMRRFAESRLNWSVVLRPVVDDMREFHRSQEASCSNAGFKTETNLSG